MDSEQISKTVDGWILEEELPQSAMLKVERSAARYFSPCEGMDDEEAEAYWAFIYDSVNREHRVIMEIAEPERFEFRHPIETDEALSFAFSSVDYQRSHPCNKYYFRLKRIYGKVKDLALTHSCISSEEGKRKVYERFKDLVNDEFRNRGVMLIETYKMYPVWVNKYRLKREIGVINVRIRKCKEIWRNYAFWE